MEKRRRERINRSLEELKDLILDQTNHNVSSKFLLVVVVKSQFAVENKAGWISFEVSRIEQQQQQQQRRGAPKAIRFASLQVQLVAAAAAAAAECGEA